MSPRPLSNVDEHTLIQMELRLEEVVVGFTLSGTPAGLQPKLARASGSEKTSSSPPPVRSLELLVRVLLGWQPKALARDSS